MKTVNTATAAEMLGVKRVAVQQAINRGKISASKMADPGQGREEWRIDVAEVERYARERKPTGGRQTLVAGPENAPGFAQLAPVADAMGWSIKQWAQAAGVSLGKARAYRVGMATPSRATLDKLAAALGVELETTTTVKPRANNPRVIHNAKKG